MSPASAIPPAHLVIGICTYNRGRKILQTLQAAAALDRFDGRVSRLIVIDNNCTDDTPAVVDAFAAARGPRDLPIERITEPTQGLAAARQRLVRATHEPLIAFLDDDCLPGRDWAASMIRAMDTHPRAGAVGGPVTLRWESGPTPLARRCATMLAQQHRGPHEHELTQPEDCLVGAAIALRREAVLQSGWLDTRQLIDRRGHELSSGGDFEICIRLRRAGWQLFYTPAASVEHIIPAERQTREYLTRLSRGVSLAKAPLKWLASGQPGLDWARQHATRARARRLRSMLLEWRPSIRPLKLAEHAGRCEGWEALIQRLSAR